MRRLRPIGIRLRRAAHLINTANRELTVQITATFNFEADVQATVEALESSGVDRAQIGVLTVAAAGAAEGGRRVGAFPSSDVPYDTDSAAVAAGAWIGGLAYLGAATAAGMVIMTGGGLGLVLSSAFIAGGGGGLAGALVTSGFHHRHAEFVHDQLEADGLGLWVDTANTQKTAIVQRIFEQHGPVYPPESGVVPRRHSTS
jgi:hypothetical protein